MPIKNLKYMVRVLVFIAGSVLIFVSESKFLEVTNNFPEAISDGGVSSLFIIGMVINCAIAFGILAGIVFGIYKIIKWAWSS